MTANAHRNVSGASAMSLDGFMNDRHGDVSRLYPDLEALRSTEMLQEEIRTIGAVVMGRHAYARADVLPRTKSPWPDFRRKLAKRQFQAVA